MIQFDWSGQIRQWLDQVWQENLGANVRIAILDTGVDLVHPALQHLDVPGHKVNVALPGFDPARLQDFNNADVTDRHRRKGHGTQCVSLLSAREEGENTLLGIVPESEIFIIKVNTPDHRTFLLKDFLKGLETAAKLKVDIIISSISFPEADLALERIQGTEVDRVFTLVEQSGAYFFAALPNKSQTASWEGIANTNFPNLRSLAINVGAISEFVYKRRKEEINAQSGVHFVVSNAAGIFCKINNEYSNETISSSYGVYIIAAVAALYIAHLKEQEQENYQIQPLSGFLSGMSRMFAPLDTGSWDATRPVLFRTRAVSVPEVEPVVINET